MFIYSFFNRENTQIKRVDTDNPTQFMIIPAVKGNMDYEDMLVAGITPTPFKEPTDQPPVETTSQKLSRIGITKEELKMFLANGVIVSV